MPVLSRLAGDPERYRRYALRALSTLAFVSMGLGAGLALVGKDLMLVVLGPQWLESGRIFKFFPPGIGALPFFFAHGWLSLSLGSPARLHRGGILAFSVAGTRFWLFLS